MKTISVIIPVYNVAPYLEMCLNSILEQDYECLDIILIDDGSTDGSGEICDAYVQRDGRIRVVHQKNAGAAAAKNAGLHIATGEYLSFVDSDDFLEQGAYAYMVKLMESENADVVHCAFRFLYCDGAEPYMAGKGKIIESGFEYIPRYLQDWTCALLWNKLYKRDLFNGVFFEEGHTIDDEFFTYQGIMNARKVVCDDHIIYNYRMRKSSVMHAAERETQKILDRVECWDQRRKKIGNRFPQYRTIFDRDYLTMLICLSREPYNTEETLCVMKHKLVQYFGSTEFTVPQIRRWPSLLLLYFGHEKMLLHICARPKVNAPDRMFL